MRSRTAVIAGLGLAAAGWLAHRHRQVRRAAPELRSVVLYLPRPIVGPASLRLARRRGRAGEPLPGVRVQQRVIPAGAAGSLEVTLYTDEANPRPGAALLWLHGGGRIAGRSELDHRLCSHLCREGGVLVVSVEYRLAPEFPFPAALDDAHATLRWLRAEAGALGIEPDRVAVGGASAGGGLAAELCQRAHDEGDPVAFQLLVYPMLDDRTRSVDRDGRGRLSWSPASNRYAWRSYLGAGADSPPPYAVAARRADLSGLPPAWIGVGDLDLFHAEDVAYAERLAAAGVPVRLRVVTGMYHAADVLVEPQPESMVRFWQEMAAALRLEVATSPPGYR